MKNHFFPLLFAIPLLLFGEDFITVPPIRIQAHVAEKPASLPDGNSVTVEDGVYTLAYHFTTEKHDALFFDLDVPLETAEELLLQVKGDGKGHTLFVVVRDQSGEKFFFPGPVIGFTDWKPIRIQFNFPTITPGDKYASIWDGDGNQQPDFPLRGITIGLNDTPDTSKDSGEIQIRKIRVK